MRNIFTQYLSSVNKFDIKVKQRRKNVKKNFVIRLAILKYKVAL